MYAYKAMDQERKKFLLPTWIFQITSFESLEANTVL